MGRQKNLPSKCKNKSAGRTVAEPCWEATAARPGTLCLTTRASARCRRVRGGRAVCPLSSRAAFSSGCREQRGALEKTEAPRHHPGPFFRGWDPRALPGTRKRLARVTRHFTATTWFVIKRDYPSETANYCRQRRERRPRRKGRSWATRSTVTRGTRCRHRRVRCYASVRRRFLTGTPEDSRTCVSHPVKTISNCDTGEIQPIFFYTLAAVACATLSRRPQAVSVSISAT